jgi:hypothetical protein
MVYPDDFFMYDEIIGDDEFEVIQKIEYPKPIPQAILDAAFSDDDKKIQIKREKIKQEREMLMKRLDKQNSHWTGWSSQKTTQKSKKQHL